MSGPHETVGGVIVLNLMLITGATIWILFEWSTMEEYISGLVNYFGLVLLFTTEICLLLA